jgi:hypothetical protein
MARAVYCLFICAAKRSGALSSGHAGWAEGSCVTSRRFNEAVLQVIVSLSLGTQLFVFTSQAVTSRSRSSPILMGWGSAQRNDFTKVLIAAGRARQQPQSPP